MRGTHNEWLARLKFIGTSSLQINYRKFLLTMMEINLVFGTPNQSVTSTEASQTDNLIFMILLFFFEHIVNIKFYLRNEYKIKHSDRSCRSGN